MSVLCIVDIIVDDCQNAKPDFKTFDNVVEITYEFENDKVTVSQPKYKLRFDESSFVVINASAESYLIVETKVLSTKITKEEK